MDILKDALRNFKNFIADAAETIVTSFIVLMSIYIVIAFPVEVSGSSMYPNLENGDRLLVDKLTRHYTEYERGEIVVLHPPKNDYIDYVKRIVGIPGDMIKIENCEILISRNNIKFKLNEGIYLSSDICTTGGKSIVNGRSYILGNDEYIVLGDNRENSSDSRYFGVVERNRIQGKVVARFWPFDKFKIY